MADLNEAFRQLDGPQEPPAAFAEDLEQRWLRAMNAASVETPEIERADESALPEQEFIVLKKLTSRTRIAYRAIAAAAAVLVLVAVAAVALESRDDDPSPPVDGGGTATTVPVPASTDGASPLPSTLSSGDVLAAERDVSAATPGTDSGPFRAAPIGDAVWAPTDSGTVALLDPATLDVVSTVDSGLSDVFDVLAVGDETWFAGDAGVARLSEGGSTGVVVPGLVGTGGWLIAASDGAVWAANFGQSEIHRFDRATGELATVAIDAPVHGLAASGDRTWVMTDEGTDAPFQVALLDESGSIITTVPMPFPSLGRESNAALATEDGVWFTGGGTGAWMQQVRNDGSLGPTVELPGDWADGMDAGDEGIWVAVRFGSSVYLIDSATGAVLRSVPVPDRTAGVQVDGDTLFTASYRAQVVQRIELTG